MVGSKSRTAAKKKAAEPWRPYTKAQKAEIDRRTEAVIAANPNAPGIPMVRAIAELAKLGPYNFKRLKS